LHAQNFTPQAEEQAPPAFLSLAPQTSATYPLQNAVAPPKSPLIVPTDAVTSTAEEVEAELLKHRRSSSSTSDASAKPRYLKLGPVHFGKGDGKSDWSDVE